MATISWEDAAGEVAVERHFKTKDAANLAYDQACAEADHGKGPGPVVILHDGETVKRHRGIFIDDRADAAPQPAPVEIAVPEPEATPAAPAPPKVKRSKKA